MHRSRSEWAVAGGASLFGSQWSLTRLGHGMYDNGQTGRAYTAHPPRPRESANGRAAQELCLPKPTQ